MTEESDKNGGLSADVKVGWRRLSTELQHKIIAHAVDDPDRWRAIKTFTSLLGTSRWVRDLANSRRFREYKENLDGARLVSDAVIETAFPDNNFSDNLIWGNDRHIGKEAAAVTPALEFQSPKMRSKIFYNIAAKTVAKRMLGYSHIAERADLFQDHEASFMDRDALNTFLGPDVLGRYQAAEVLAKRYNDIASETRAELEEALSNSENQVQREDFSDAIVYCNPSLLKDDGFRKMVYENLDSSEDPHEALAQLASYVDKNSRAHTDFFIEKSFQLLGGKFFHGGEHQLEALSRAIARVFDGNISEENRARIAELRQSDTEDGRALASAFKELERDRPVEASMDSGGMRGSLKLMREMVRSQNISDEVAAIDGVREVATSNEKQVNAARKALMKFDRDDHVR
ncbi:hypothetical protein [Rhizobium terrae]|uniref:hypothetical protein n=1 Tax=Rhizobium terrae TaxID=2171756 RepID=UPI000E3D8B90|nr:hypothetical protein [Rhizobium terrae]